MEKLNVFEKVMNFIDENIRKNYNDIKDGVYAVSNYSEMQFTKVISIFSNENDTLRTYFKRRKAYFAAKELVDNPEKSILEIALEYGYADQPKFTNEMKKNFGHTPKEIRTNKIRFEDNKLLLSNFKSSSDKIGKRLQDAIDGMISGNAYSDYDYFFEFIKVTDEYGFDTSTCLAISEVSEKIGVPFGTLLNLCFITMIECQNDKNYIEPKVEKAIECDITLEELEEICEELGCEYYNLNPIMVEMYKKGVDHLTLG